MKKLIPSILTTVSIVILFVACTDGSPDISHLDTTPIDKSKVDITKTRISIDKSDYQLHLYEGDKLLKTYPVVLGPNPIDDKMREGDGCTPEGVFHVRTKYAHAKWSRFIWVDYPNEESWKKFEKRKIEGMIPKDATIGGDIGIHGVWEGYDSMIADRENWTLGCISLTNPDIRELYDLVRDGTEIEIHK